MSLERAHYPDHIIAEAHNLLRFGYSLRRVVERLASAFPGEPIPSHTTIAEYERRLYESQQGETNPRESRIIEQADNLIAAGLEHGSTLEPDQLWKSLVPLNVIAGTYRDKQIKRAQLQLDRSQNQRLVFVFNGIQIPDAIPESDQDIIQLDTIQSDSEPDQTPST